MDFVLNAVYYVVPFIILLSVLVFVHEFGHFIVARMSGVSVSAFSIGFGKTLWSRKDKHGTTWQIAAIPLGGYCQFLGDADASSSTSEEDLKKKLSPEEQKSAFICQSPWKKLAIVCAGPLSNYLFAILLFAGIFYFLGNIVFPPVVGDVIPDSPAERASLQKNDRILSINGHKVSDFSDINVETNMAVDGKVMLEILRGEEVVYIPLELQEIEMETDDGSVKRRPMIGIKSISAYEIQHTGYSLWQALSASVEKTWNITVTTLRGVGQMITGDRSSDEIGGIIRIAEMSGDITKGSGFIDFLIFAALISINLGLINFFPIPLLDGGHVVLYIIEIITGRPINEKIKNWLFRFGLFFIIALMIFATWNDIWHLFNRWF